MNRIKRRKSYGYENLEERRLLAVNAYTNGPDLFIKGSADGLVEITSTNDSTFTVTDNGNNLGTFTGVDRTIRIFTDRNGTADDHVRVDFAHRSVENLLVNLGNGNNTLEVNSLTFNDGGVSNRLFFKGGAGNDVLNTHMQTKGILTGDMGGGNDIMTAFGRGDTIRFLGGQGEDEFTIQKEEHYFESFATGAIHAGPGDDVINIDGKIWNPQVWAGSGNDVVNFGGTTLDSFVHLGQGNNTFNHTGWAAGDVRVRGGAGHDTVNFYKTDSSTLGGNAYILLGDGDNHFNIDGSMGFGQDKEVLLRGGNGNDTVNVAADAVFGGDLRSILGDGNNIMDNHGDVDGDLVAISRNTDDAFADYGNVEGRIYLKPGGQN